MPRKGEEEGRPAKGAKRKKDARKQVSLTISQKGESERKRQSERERDIYIYIYICCEVINWSKFGLFNGYKLVQVRVTNWSKVIFAL